MADRTLDDGSFSENFSLGREAAFSALSVRLPPGGHETMVTTKNETAVGPDLRALSGALSGHSPARRAPSGLDRLTLGVPRSRAMPTFARWS
jgi:hypothetical protein|tara:strand:+ start:112 stop:387 length:276 start_codon:yes stop_codon:yes gene_type:complete